MSEGAGKHELPTGHPEAGRPLRRRRTVVSTCLVAVLCALLGLAIVTQVRDTDSRDGLDSARPADLLALLDNLHQREAASRGEISGLQQSLAVLQAGGRGSDAALDEARSRLAALQIEAGTIAATGPGVTSTISDPQGQVGPDVLLDQIQELRAAGAEAMEISGGPGSAGPVRIAVDTAVTATDGRIHVDGQAITQPYRIVAIGDPPTLAAALNIAGGAVDTVARAGGAVAVEQSQQLEVPALRQEKSAQYARPGG